MRNKIRLNVIVTLVLSRNLGMSCYRIPFQKWDLIRKVRKTKAS